MKNLDRQMDDELRPEYDLQSLRVRKVGSGRKESNRADITQNNQSCLAEKINLNSCQVFLLSNNYKR